MKSLFFSIIPLLLVMAQQSYAAATREEKPETLTAKCSRGPSGFSALEVYCNGENIYQTTGYTGFAPRPCEQDLQGVKAIIASSQRENKLVKISISNDPPNDFGVSSKPASGPASSDFADSVAVSCEFEGDSPEKPVLYPIGIDNCKSAINLTPIACNINVSGVSLNVHYLAVCKATDKTAKDCYKTMREVGNHDESKGAVQ